jgi:Sec-independent protein translocase protein TatA
VVRTDRRGAGAGTAAGAKALREQQENLARRNGRDGLRACAAAYRGGVFESLGWPETATLLTLALFVFGPERLPAVARDAGRLVGALRRSVSKLTDDVRQELGPEVGDLDLKALHPRTFVAKHLLEDEEERPPVPAAGADVGARGDS